MPTHNRNPSNHAATSHSSQRRLPHCVDGKRGITGTHGDDANSPILVDNRPANCYKGSTSSLRLIRCCVDDNILAFRCSDGRDNQWETYAEKYHKVEPGEEPAHLTNHSINHSGSASLISTLQLLRKIIREAVEFGCSATAAAAVVAERSR